MKVLTAMVVDDEPLARAHVRMMLEAQGVEILGEAENAAEALQQSEDLHPDLLFLDIQMPGISGMQVASALMYQDNAPLLIFVTGYSEYAMEAFEWDPLDYLVKPVAVDRLAKTLVRARSRLSNRDGRLREQQIIEKQAHTTALKRLPIREDYSVRLIRVEEIICATAREKRVYVHAGEKEYRTYYTLTQLEDMLSSDQFLRIHDSCLVNLDSVDAVHFLGNHSYVVHLSNGLNLPVGRSRYAELQRRLNLTGPAS